MGWLCPQCGAENAFLVRRCEACGKSAGVAFRVWNQLGALCERLCDGEPIESEVWGPWGVFPQFFRANRLTRTFLYAQAVACLTCAAFLIVAAAWTNGGFSVREPPEGVSYARTLERRLARTGEIMDAVRDSGRDGLRKLDEFRKKAGIAADSARLSSVPDGTAPAESRVPDGTAPAESRVPDRTAPAESRMSEQIDAFTGACENARSRASQQWEALKDGLNSLGQKAAFWKPYLEGRDES